jgi:hypothetical protein
MTMGYIISRRRTAEIIGLQYVPGCNPEQPESIFFHEVKFVGFYAFF